MSEKQDTTVTIRQPSTALLCVNSEDARLFDNNGFRVDNNTPADVYINKQRPLMFGYMSRVALTEVNLEWSTPNVNETNNTLTIGIWNKATNTLNGYRRITLLPGFYNLPEICKAIEFQLNNSVSNVFGYDLLWKVRWGQMTNIPAIFTKNFSIFIELNDNDTGAGFQIVSSKVQRPTSQTGLALPLPAKIDDLTYMTGLTAIANFTPIGNIPGVQNKSFYTFIESAYPSMQYTPFVDIVSNLLTKNQQVSDDCSTKAGLNSILTRLYLSNQEIVQRTVTAQYSIQSPAVSGDAQSGALTSSTDNAIGVRPFAFRREFANPKQISWNRVENIDVIDLRVLDRLGNVIYVTPTGIKMQTDVNEFLVQIGNDSDFQFTVSVTEA